MRRFGSLSVAFAFVSAFLVLAGCGSGGGSQRSVSEASAFPDANALAHAASDNNDWPLPGKSYANNRYTELSQITPDNVRTLAKAWTTELIDNGQQESSMLVWGNTIYFATPHDNVLALDGTTGRVKWQFPYSPSYSILYNVSRGVGLEGGKVFLATMDCRVIAIDATSGKKIFNVNGCPNDAYTSTKNSLFSMASYVYKDQVILGTAGGDDGNVGHVMAFSTLDGHRIWDWRNIPFPGEPGGNTWPGNTWQHGAGDTWSGVTLDPATETLFIPVGNPGPDLVDTYRKGQNLYTDSVLALDVSGAKPKLKWYYQLTRNDTHDVDPAMPPVIFDGKVEGTTQPLLAIGDKGGNFVVLDRTSGKLVYRLSVDNQHGLLTTIPTLTGTVACPDHGGGIEWNGGAYDPGTNYFLVPSTQECALWKIATTDPQYIAGQPYTGGPLPKRTNGTGEITAIDMGTGKVAWVKKFAAPAQGGALTTSTGITFTSDTDGDLFAFDTKNGNVLWQTKAGASIVAPFTMYSDGTNEYLLTLAGSAGAQQTPNVPVATSSFVTAYRLGPVENPIVNTTAGQIAVTAAAGNGPASVGSAPYTDAQVVAGAQAYRQSCAACHGAQLQGVSAPALTGTSMGTAKLTLTQLHSVVTTQMPLTAPGSLKPAQYAAIMAYILSYDCVAQAGGGKVPYPATALPSFRAVIIGGKSCPPKE